MTSWMTIHCTCLRLCKKVKNRKKNMVRTTRTTRMLLKLLLMSLCCTATWDSMSRNGRVQGFMVARVCTSAPSTGKKSPLSSPVKIEKQLLFANPYKDLRCSKKTMRSAINSCASHNLTTSFLLLLFYAITGLVMSVEQTAWTDLSMVDPDRWGPTTNMNVSECMMWPPNLMSITMDLPFYLTRIVTYHQKYFVILCTQEVFFVLYVAREGVSSWVTLSNREFWNTRRTQWR